MNEDDTLKHTRDVQDAAEVVPYNSGDGKRINRVQRPTGTSGDPMGCFPNWKTLLCSQ